MPELSQAAAFYMPTESGSKQAVVVSSTTANRPVSAYTIMLQLIALQLRMLWRPQSSSLHTEAGTVSGKTLN